MAFRRRSVRHSSQPVDIVVGEASRLRQFRDLAALHDLLSARKARVYIQKTARVLRHERLKKS